MAIINHNTAQIKIYKFDSTFYILLIGIEIKLSTVFE